MKKKFWKTVVFVLAIIGLYNVATCSIMLYPEPKNYNFFRYSGPITEEELQSFLPVWEKFVEKYADNAGISEISLTQGLPAEIMPLGMKLWLRNQNWDINRFFYVEQRLHDVVNYVYLKRHAKEVIEVMESAYERESNKDMRENICNVIAIQEELLNNKKANNSETLIIEKHLNEIIRVIEN